MVTVTIFVCQFLAGFSVAVLRDTWLVELLIELSIELPIESFARMHATLVSEAGSIGMAQEMAQQLELPLPEITTEDFERSWICFNLVATAKKWDEAKQLSIVPALLRGKLVEIFVDLEDEEKANIKMLKRALSVRAGLTSDPLASARCFNDRKQEPGEKVSDYARELKRLYSRAYPGEDAQSIVLVQHFLTGLRAPISQQLLLKECPATMEKAVKGAIDVEYALQFGQETVEVHAVQRTIEDKRLEQLTQTVERMAIQMEKLESQLKADRERPSERSSNSNRMARRHNLCFLCGQEGHFRRSCPLNGNVPARKVPGVWHEKK